MAQRSYPLPREGEKKPGKENWRAPAFMNQCLGEVRTGHPAGQAQGPLRGLPEGLDMRAILGYGTSYLRYPPTLRGGEKGMPMSSHIDQPAHLTIPELAGRKASAGRGAPLTMITAYDVVSARLADRAGAELLLVGDSVGMVVLGRENTLTVTVEEILHHARAVTAAKPRAVVVGDMPFLSYHISISEAIRNAGLLISQGGCQAVKVEGGRRCLRIIERLLCADIPVMGHLGLTPQSVHRMGGFRVQARQAEAAEALMEEACLLAGAGVFAIVLEGIPAEVAQVVTEAIAVPTIGIGAGPHCDGQVLVWHDLLGLTEGLAPKFVRRYADVGSVIVEALARFVGDVRAGTFPSSGESYHASPAVTAAVRARSNHADPTKAKIMAQMPEETGS